MTQAEKSVTSPSPSSCELETTESQCRWRRSASLPSLEVVFDNGRLSLTCEIAHAIRGWYGISFEINDQRSTQQTYRRLKTPDAFTWQTHYPSLALTETLEVRDGPVPRSVVVSRWLQADQTISIHALRDGLLDDIASLRTWTPNARLRLAHSSHLHTEHFPRARPEYPYVRPPAYELRRYGLGEANDLPVLMLTDESLTQGLLEAALIDGPLRRIWATQIKSNMTSEGFERWFADLVPIGAQQYTLEAGRRQLVSQTLYQVVVDTHVRDMVVAPSVEMARTYPPRGHDSNMRLGACYCTWNYGVERDVTQDALLERAKVIRKHFPHVHHFLLDDGYQTSTRSLDAYFPTPADNIDRRKFPDGLNAFAEQLRQLGLQPGIWFSPMLDLRSELAQTHPDWLLLNQHGRPFNLNQNGYLDLSVPAAREWLLSILDMLYGPDRFVGCKLDFQSQMFEADSLRYRQGNGLIWRDWLYQQIRDRIGDEGFFETCIAMSSGNPRLAQWCDGYRIGADISDGLWQQHVDSARWMLPALAIPGRETLLLNADSFGWCEQADERVNRHRAAWCFITGGLLEFGGKLEMFEDDILAFYAKVLNQPDRGHPCRVVDARAFTGLPLPTVCAIDYPEHSRTAQRGICKHIALFNWTDQPQMTGATLEQLQLDADCEISDFWDDQVGNLRAEGLFELLPPRGSRLLTVRKL